MPHLRRDGRHVDVFVRHIFEEADEIDFLLIVAAQRGARLLPDDRHDRLMIHLGIVKAIQEMNRARAGGGEANADFAGELGVRAGHERGHFLVPHLDEFDRVARPINGADDAVDAIAGKSVDSLDSPGREPLKKKIADLVAHMLFVPLVLLRIRDGCDQRVFRLAGIEPRMLHDNRYIRIDYAGIIGRRGIGFWIVQIIETNMLRSARWHRHLVRPHRIAVAVVNGDLNVRFLIRGVQQAHRFVTRHGRFRPVARRWNPAFCDCPMFAPDA